MAKLLHNSPTAKALDRLSGTPLPQSDSVAQKKTAVTVAVAIPSAQAPSSHTQCVL